MLKKTYVSKQSPRERNTVFDIHPHERSIWNRVRATVYLRRHIYRRYPVAVSLVALVVVLITVFGADTLLSHANTVYWYPKSCLGGWTNPNNASGAPELSPSAAADDFSADNSAILDGTLSQIFCGEFNGDVPEKSVPLSVTLNISWAFKTAPSAGGITQSLPSSTPDPTGEVFSTDVIPTSSEADPVSEPEALPDPEPVLEVSPSSSTDTTTENSSDAAFSRFFPVAFAQETSTAEEATTSEVGVSVVATDTDAALPEDSAEPDGQLRGQDILEIRYSTDGEHWESLGRVGEANWRTSRFPIPVSAWNDLQKLQISVVSLPVSDIAPVVYLDGVSLIVDYGPENPIVENILEQTTSTLPIASTRFDLSNSTTSSNRATGIQEFVHLAIVDDGSGLQVLQVSVDTSANLFFYNLSDPSLSISVGVGNQALEMPIYNFPVGDFVVINTLAPEDCDGKDIDACRNGPGYIGEASFSVH